MVRRGSHRQFRHPIKPGGDLALLGVGAAAASHEAAEQLISEAIALHVQGLAEDGLAIPDPRSVDVGQVELRQPA